MKKNISETSVLLGTLSTGVFHVPVDRPEVEYSILRLLRVFLEFRQLRKQRSVRFADNVFFFYYFWKTPKI